MGITSEQVHWIFGGIITTIVMLLILHEIHIVTLSPPASQPFAN